MNQDTSRTELCYKEKGEKDIYLSFGNLQSATLNCTDCLLCQFLFDCGWISTHLYGPPSRGGRQTQRLTSTGAGKFTVRSEAKVPPQSTTLGQSEMDSSHEKSYVSLHNYVSVLAKQLLVCMHIVQIIHCTCPDDWKVGTTQQTKGQPTLSTVCQVPLSLPFSFPVSSKTYQTDCWICIFGMYNIYYIIRQGQSYSASTKVTQSINFIFI